MLLPRSTLPTAAVHADLLKGAGYQVGESRWTACVIRFKSASILFIVVYLWTSQGLSDQNSAILHEIFTLVSLFAGLVVIAGDWQMEPSELQRSPWISFLNLDFAFPDDVDATCKAGPARFIDFFVLSAPLRQFVDSQAVFSVPWEPHIGLRLDIPCNLRSFVAPHLQIPRSLPNISDIDSAELDVDDLWQRSCDLADSYIRKWTNGTGVLGASWHTMTYMDQCQAEISRKHTLSTTRIEFFTCMVAGHRGRDIFPFVGRGALPHFADRPVIRRTFADATFSCPHTDFWFRMVSLMKWLLKATPQKLHSSSLLQPMASIKSNARHLALHWNRMVFPNFTVEEWIQWISLMTPASVVFGAEGFETAKVQAFIDAAEAQKKKALSTFRAQRKRSFRQWLSKDLSTGASKAHALVKDIPRTSAPSHDIAASAFSLWSDLWGSTSSPFQEDVPCSQQWPSMLLSFLRQVHPHSAAMQPVALVKNAAADRDLVHLAGPQDSTWTFLPAQFRVEYEQYLIGAKEPLDLVSLRSAIASYPDKKAKGVDMWLMATLQKLPDDALEGLLDVLNMAHSTLLWPLQLLINLMALIPKPQGGERPIAKTPMLYRLFNVMKSLGVKDWSRSTTKSFDYAAAGKSAVYSGAARCLLNELATLSDKEAAALLWDMDKFFDRISPTLVAQRGLHDGYPIEDLALALSMHIAPRVLSLGPYMSSLIFPTVSILAGCSHSVDFAKLIMYPVVDAPLTAAPKTRTYSFVDDVSQAAIGSFRLVLNTLIRAGFAFVKGVRASRLVISPKSVVVASSPRLAQLVARALHNSTGVSLTQQSGARDLGVMNNPTRRRNTSLQQQRLRKTKARLLKISPLAKTLRRARSLTVTGATPQATWGAGVIGIAPTQMSRLRSWTAASSGITAHGRCRTTAIAVAFGHLRDPMIVCTRQQVDLWIQLWRGEPQLRQLAVRHWRDAHARLQPPNLGHEASSTSSWNGVIGPFTTTLAVLRDTGWNCEQPGAFVDPSGIKWIPSLDTDVEPFLDLVDKFTLQAVWRDAATFWCGSGAQQGIEWHSTMALHRHLTRLLAGELQDSFPEVNFDGSVAEEDLWDEQSLGWLELLLTGGFWPQMRYADTAGGSSLCPRCRRAPESALHLFWQCPANDYMLDPRVVDSQYLKQSAVEGAEDNACLWLRGLLPLGLIPLSTPYPDNMEWHYVGLDPPVHAAWPSGRYYTDASGGAFSSIKLLRRVGFAAVYLNQNEDAFDTLFEELSATVHNFVFGAFSVLPGHHQTVPRGELHAIVSVVLSVQQGTCTIYTDSKISADLFGQGKARCLNSENSDLWSMLWSHIDAGGINVTLVWTKGHVDTVQVMEDYHVSRMSLVGNTYADALANRAADLAQVATQDSMTCLWHFSAVRHIQARCVAILMATMPQRRQLLLTRPVRDKIPRAVSVMGCAISTQHRLLAFSKTLHCYVCHKHSSSTAAGRRQFLQSPCNVNHDLVNAIFLGRARPISIPQGTKVQVGRRALHDSHQLHVYRGLYFCGLCGYSAATKAQMLVDKCEVRGKAAKQRVSRLFNGNLPSGLANWPNEVSDTKPGASLLLG